jgi:hypothetical protein
MNKIKNNVVFYTDRCGDVELRADVERDTLWATINQIGDIFHVQKAAVSKHLRNIYSSGELGTHSTVSILETVQTEGSRAIKRKIKYYNLDAIIAVGYRVNSRRATRFRIWATRVLREYLVNGFAIRQKKLAGPEQNFDNLQEALSFMESGSRGGPLKARLSLRLFKDVMK